MDSRDLEQIDAFLSEVGQASLLEYYGVQTTMSPQDIATRIKSKRTWAQAQQANPKFRAEALWLIKNNKLVHRILGAELQAYSEAVSSKERDRKLEMLDLFVQGSLVHGKLSNTAEGAIRRQATELGLSEPEVSRYLEEKLEQVSHISPGDADILPPASEPEEADYYEVLKVSPDATVEEIEQAYRARYRWARSLKDLQRANAIYSQLDEACQHLASPEKRKAYDARRADASPAPGTTAPQDKPEPRPPSAFPEPTPFPSRLPARNSLPKSEDSAPSGEPQEEAFSGSYTPIPSPMPRWTDSADGEGSSQPDSRMRESPSVPLRLAEPAPEPPDRVGRRSFEPGTPGEPARPRHTPRLQVDGPDHLAFSLLLRPKETSIQVRNAGKGQIRGHVASSQAWLQATPKTLLLRRESKTIRIASHPRRMSGRSGRARVTISTSHGERWVITVDAHKRRIAFPVTLSLALILLALAVTSRMGLLPFDIPFLPTPYAGEVRTFLHINVAPPADVILINDIPVGSGASLPLEDPVPPGTAIELEVRRAGHQTWTESLVLADGQRKTLKVELLPEDKAPPPSEPAEATTIVAPPDAAPAEPVADDGSEQPAPGAGPAENQP